MKLQWIIPLFLALALAIALFSFSYAAEGTGIAGVSDGPAPVSASFSNGSLSWTISPGKFMGVGLVIAATYNADGKMLDSKTTQVADLSVQHSEKVTLSAEDGGTYRVFLLEASTYSPLMKALQGDTEITGEEKSKLEVVVGDTVFTATLADTQAAKEFVQLLPLTIAMNDYGDFEKVGSLGRSLTANDEQTTTTAGDIVLYNSSNIVIFYGSNSWSYTRIGKIDDLTGWANALGSGSVSVTFRLSGSQQEPSESGSPVVYMTTDISPEGLLAVYEALSWTPNGNVAVKLSTGEPPASNYLRPELIKDLVQSVDGTIVECNTAYGGSRASAAMHYQVAKDHGFTDIADFQILDENGSMTLPVEGGSVLTENYVGAAFTDYDSYLILSHFKGHSMAGFGGAIKNISIGLGSSEGKAWIHSGGTSRTNAWGGQQDAFLEAMAEAGKSVADYLGNGEGIVYVNVMNRLSVDCDCDGHPAEPDIHDIGILASTDPVALDQACVDLIYAEKDGEGASLVNRIESRNGLHTLEHAEEIGLGSRTYTLVSIDN